VVQVLNDAEHAEAIRLHIPPLMLHLQFAQVYGVINKIVETDEVTTVA